MPKFEIRPENLGWWVCIDGNPYRLFETEEEAQAVMARLQELLSGLIISVELKGDGIVLDFALNESWLIRRGRSFVILPPTDIDFKIGEKVQVDESGRASRAPEQGQDPGVER